MTQPVSFQRLYKEGAGIEYPVQGAVVANVLKAMNDAARSGLNPFRVRFRLDDGTSVVVKPRGWVS